MTAQTPGQALADAWEAQALKCDEAAALPGLAKAAALEQATFAAQLRDCARQLRELAAQEPQPAPAAKGAGRVLLTDYLRERGNHYAADLVAAAQARLTLQDTREMRQLLQDALFLHQNGEYSPADNKNWHDWDDRAGRLLRGLPREEPFPDGCSCLELEDGLRSADPDCPVHVKIAAERDQLADALTAVLSGILGLAADLDRSHAETGNHRDAEFAIMLRRLLETP